MSACACACADTTNPSKGVWLQYTGGDRCPLTNLYRSLKVWLQCYNDATNIPDDEVRGKGGGEGGGWVWALGGGAARVATLNWLMRHPTADLPL
jgi:hypothetical protein